MVLEAGEEGANEGENEIQAVIAGQLAARIMHLDLAIHGK